MLGYWMTVADPEKQGHDEEGAGFILEHVQDHVVIELPTVLGIDMSITIHVLMMWIACAILLLLFALARRQIGLVPRGFGNAVESVVVFLKGDIIEAYLGEEGKRFTPYLLTAFFFVLTCNLLGLVPGAATATSNLAVTGTLAVLTFLIGQTAGILKKGIIGYFKSFLPAGVPGFVAPIVFFIEFIGVFTKHSALAIRLFANMMADHLIVLTFLGLIIIFKSYLVALLAVPGAVALELLAVLIALIQAYIFTMLSAVFIGIALAEEH